MFALIRGILAQDIDEMILKVTMDLNLQKHLKKPIKYYSGGNKRKLSAAIALIGNPVIVYLGMKFIFTVKIFTSGQL